MEDLLNFLSGDGLWKIATIAVIFDVALTGAALWFTRPAVLGPFDPLRIQLIVFICPAMTGYVLSPFATGAWTTSFFVILVFIVTWLAIIRMGGRPKRVSMIDAMPANFQRILLLLTCAVIVTNVIVNMIIPGTIPLFTEEGVNSRFEAAESSRFLTWLNFGTVTIPGLIFAITQHSKIRRLSAAALVLQLATGFLFASKAAIVTIFFVLLFSVFVAGQRREVERARSLARFGKRLLIPVACLVPIYLSVIGFASDSSALFSLGYRFFAGFDQLIPAAQLGLVVGPKRVLDFGASVVEYQALPVFKALGAEYHYSNIGQYIVEAVTGRLIEGGFTFPNSNLILETTFTSGAGLGYLVFVLELVAFYAIRRLCLATRITAGRLPWFAGTVMAPCGLFLSGQEWVVGLLMTSVVVGTAVAITWVLETSLGLPVISHRSSRATGVRR